MNEQKSTFSPEQIKALQADLDRRHVASRSQAGRSLSYIEGWHAIAEANRIFGFDAWDRETVELRQLGDHREIEGKFRVAYMAKVRVKVRPPHQMDASWWVVREGCGYGSGIDRDLGSAHESALKEAETDAMKRALMTFGNPFGLALYDKQQRHVGNGEEPAAEAKPNGRKPADPAGGAHPVTTPRNQRKLYDVIRDEVAASPTVKDLTSLYKTFQPQITEVAKAEPGMGDSIMKLFGNRRRELEGDLDAPARQSIAEIRESLLGCEQLKEVANVLHAFEEPLSKLQHSAPAAYDELMSIADQMRNEIRSRAA